MKTKNLILFALISSFFLIFLVSIFKILATLQGLDIQNFNLQIIFIFGLLISFANLRIGNKIKIFYKSIIFSLIFVACDGYIIQKLPKKLKENIFLFANQAEVKYRTETGGQIFYPKIKDFLQQNPKFKTETISPQAFIVI